MKDAAVFDVVVVGATPGGIAAAVSAGRAGRRVVLLERSSHVGGLPANGLGATDIATRGATTGLFAEFVGRVRRHYATAYGEGSEQVRLCSDGYHFEPAVAERVLEAMLNEQANVTVRRMRQFDGEVEKRGDRLTAVVVRDRETGEAERYAGRVFVDGTYEGDLAAAAGCAFSVRREGFAEHREPLAGRVYKRWGSRPTELGEGSTQEGDEVIQAYNYRLCLTDVAENRVAIGRPAGYRREEYRSLAEDVRLGRTAGPHTDELEWDGIGRVVNMVRLPNGKTDSNNQHLAFLSTDLPEENWKWPTADWAWRDRFAERLRDYTLGLLYFAQTDPSLPEAFRRNCLRWGLAKDEYGDNGHFPRQVYVREGRRIEGEYWFTAQDALPREEGGRPPVHADSITASHYPIDSHAVRKREEGRVHLDGFLSLPTRPYTVPYGVIVPKGVENLVSPVAVSGTHLGFSTLRMEPCWMALGQAAGEAAALAAEAGAAMKKVDVPTLQARLLAGGATLIYYRDLRPGDPGFAEEQRRGLKGELSGWDAKAADR